MSIIKPTVGRVVWYYPHASDGLYANNDGPLAGMIAKVWSDTCVNLGVLDGNGINHSRTSVYLYPGERMPRPAIGTGFAEWMPYQKGQAAKTEALEKELDGTVNMGCA